MHSQYGTTSVQLALGVENHASDDGGNIHRSLQIDMKTLVGDAVGNMSISPASRDVVLATRRGLYIIDLEAPFEVPRFLPQGGTFNVADVQWNPHPSRAEYIVSTSSEKLLIWNLFLVGKTSIEYILQSKYPVDGPTRSVTDVDWAPEPDLLVSTGIDSWLWAWDLRETRKPAFGFSAFNAGGTQVKWNHRDSNILASSHASEVILWDRRKGSFPISRFKAHSSKVYGIDWSCDKMNEIVTCSLDKTIKTWDIHSLDAAPSPIQTIHAKYPVWRARHIPFGRGLLTLPQRGSAELEMWKNEAVVERFTGHSDVVKEFVWRKGSGGNTFQLITWSTDRSLRFWPIHHETLELMEHDMNRGGQPDIDPEDSLSFRNPPEGMDCPPALSVPMGHRSILADLRAPSRLHNLVMQPHQGSAVRSSLQDKVLSRQGAQADVVTPASSSFAVNETRRAGTMSRGHNSRKSHDMDAFAWLSSVKLGRKRESSESLPSVTDSPRQTWLGFDSGQPELGGESRAMSHRRSSNSRSKVQSTNNEISGASQSLQDEITSVLSKLSSARIKLEKHDLTKRRTCTLGLHGPWGASSSVFIRITFFFPREYPHSRHPHGTPAVDLERNPLISLKDRAFILRRLRRIREQRRPCLEACLRFLLFAQEDADEELPPAVDSESHSSEDPDHPSRAERDLTAAILRNSKNLAEPRTSQGVFGPNGELICFFRAPPRIVRNLLQDMTAFPAAAPRPPENVPRLFQAPALLSDAVRRLGSAADDRFPDMADSRRFNEGEDTLRIMTNLLASSQQRFRKDIEPTKPASGAPVDYSLLPSHSLVFISSTISIAGADRKVAAEYIFQAESLEDVCQQNALVANKYGRYDHQRIFETLGPLLGMLSAGNNRWLSSSASFLQRFINDVYAEIDLGKDLQMLSMIAVLVLQAYRSARPRTTSPLSNDKASIPPKLHEPEDFNKGQLSAGNQAQYLPTNPSPLVSSRASWSSLFNSGNMRQFVMAMHDFPKERLSPSVELSRTTSYAENGAATLTRVIPGQHRSPRAAFEKVPQERRIFMSDISPDLSKRQIDESLESQYICHVLVYAERLLRWQLLHKRLELLKSVAQEIQSVHKANKHFQERFAFMHPCQHCQIDVHSSFGLKNNCTCWTSILGQTCAICRLPVKGLSWSCPQCRHLTHVTCKHLHKGAGCPSGCTCGCVQGGDVLY